MRYLSLFDGIGAACVAWDPLGWECVGVSEIEKFPISVTTHHRPRVPHLGDVTKITENMVAALGRIDLIVGGFPCQDLSVAGKRAGLKKEDGTTTRSGLFFDAMRVVQWARQHCGLRWLLIENVPGLYSSNRGRDFAAVVGEMVGAEFDVPRDGWRNAGFAVGPEGLCEWATLDAQFFNVAQRRVRVFALADFGDWASRPPILLERDSLRGDSAPSREAGQRVAPVLAGCSNGGGANGPGRDVDSVESLQVISMAHGQGGAEIGFDRGPTLTCNHEAPIVAHTLRGEGFDASEDGTGRGTPPVPVAVDVRNQSIDGDVAATLNAESGAPNHSGPKVMVPVAFAENSRAEVRLEGGDGQRVGAISTGGGKPGQGVPMIAFMADDYKDGGYEECDTARPLTTSADRTRAAPVVTTLAIRGRGDSHDLETRTDGTANALLTPNGGRGGIGVGAIHCGMQVRRLTPVECSRLQGFPDDYLSQVPWRGKSPPPDGPMYKALGNSMAVPVMRWIGRQIAAAARCNEAAA